MTNVTAVMTGVALLLIRHGYRLWDIYCQRDGSGKQQTHCEFDRLHFPNVLFENQSRDRQRGTRVLNGPVRTYRTRVCV